MQKDIPQSVDPDEPKTPGRAIFSGAHDYFVNNVLPDTIQAHVSRYQTPTSYANNRDQTFILVRSGKGKALINGLEYNLKPNTLINLGPFHRYRFLPSKGAPLEIAEARMNSSTYIYMIANPYLKCEFRVRYAEALLTTTSLPTVDIAIESGFGSDRTMARVFYNINGISPGEFRKARKLPQKAGK